MIYTAQAVTVPGYGYGELVIDNQVGDVAARTPLTVNDDTGEVDGDIDDKIRACGYVRTCAWVTADWGLIATVRPAP